MQQVLPTSPVHHRFTIEDLERMVRAGILHEHDRVELIEGELFDMNPIGWAHQACVDWLTATFVRRLGDRAIVRTQGPIRIGDRSLPQPDLTLLEPRPDFYRHEGPRASDVLLLVEVSDTTLPYDRDVKVPLYARAGIPEVWLVDLAGEQVLVFREPAAGRYRASVVVRPGEQIGPLRFPDVTLDVAALLGI
ncbi:MAG: Uma2 family endonuclease [Thermomicrobium sp.]|nr:Uma2 family endonuclease [Thermomicrobium sp.]